MAVLSGALAAVLLVLAVGYAAYRGWGPAQPARSSEPVVIAFTIISCGILAISWLGFTLVQLGHFSLPLLIGLSALCIGISVVQARRRRVAAVGPTWDRSLLPMLVVAIVAAVAIARPFEYVLGARDPGVYANAGVLIAQTGTTLQEDPLAAQIPDDAAPSFFEPFTTGGFQRLPGFQFVDADRSVVVPQFFHLLPTWIGVLYSLGGLPLSLWATPLFGLLAVLAVYVAGRLLLGGAAGLLGALLLALNVSQVWYARYPTAETMTQYLLFAGLAFFALFIRHRASFWGVLAAVALGELYFARVDMFFVPLALAAFLIWEWWNRRLEKRYVSVAGVHLALLAQAGAYALGPALAYTRHAYAGAFSASGLGFATLGLLSGGFVVTAGVTPLGSRLAGLGRRRQTLWTVAAVVVLAVAYAYLVRPAWQLPDLVPTAARAGNFDAENLVRIGWYVSPLGVMLGTAGYVLGLLRGPRRETVLLFLVVGGYTALYVSKALINPDHFWMIRRFVPVTIPGLLLFAGYAIAQLAGVARRWRGGLVLAAGIWTLLALYSLNNLAPLWPHLEMEGVASQLAHLDEALPEGAIVVFEDPAVGNALSVPLRYLHGRDVFVLQPNAVDQTAVQRVVRQWWEQGRQVVFLASGTAMALSPDAYSFVPLGSAELRFPVFERSLWHLPRSQETSVMPVDIYRLEPATLSRTVARIEVGRQDYAYLRGGFFAPGVLPDGTPVRWTGPVATLSLPVGGGVSALAIRARADRPAQLGPVPLTVYANDTKLGTVLVTGELTVFRFDLPASLADNGHQLVVRLESKTWRPSDFGEADTRQLGVQVNWVELVP